VRLNVNTIGQINKIFAGIYVKKKKLVKLLDTSGNNEIKAIVIK